MNRRDAPVVLATAAVAGPHAAFAQPRTPRRVAWIWTGGPERNVEVTRTALAGASFPAGRDLVFEVHVVEQTDEAIRRVVDGIIAKGVDALVAQGQVCPAVHRAVGGRVPTVVAFSGDVVAAGLVESLRRPGRRTTGVSFLALELVGKRLEILKELAPTAKRVGVLLNARHYGYQAELEETRAAAQRLGLDAEVFEIRGIEDFAGAYAAMARARLSGVVLFPDATMTRAAKETAAFALRERLPLVSGWAVFPQEGALASYGPDLGEAYRLVGGHYLARILRGEDPSTMPVERPSRLYLVVNLRTANALGVAVPSSVLARADEVIR